MTGKSRNSYVNTTGKTDGDLQMQNFVGLQARPDNHFPFET